MSGDNGIDPIKEAKWRWGFISFGLGFLLIPVGFYAPFLLIPLYAHSCRWEHVAPCLTVCLVFAALARWVRYNWGIAAALFAAPFMLGYYGLHSLASAIGGLLGDTEVPEPEAHLVECCAYVAVAWGVAWLIRRLKYPGKRIESDETTPFSESLFD